MIKHFLGTVALAAFFISAPLHAQFNFNIGKETVHVHSFATQGYAYSKDNNFLTMETSKGSFEMTDAGLNGQVQFSDKFHAGAQVYVRNIGHLGGGHPELDWGYGDYKLKDWLGFRGGKVKTALGLYNDIQDMEFLNTWALLPQSCYPTDLRSNTIAHVGGDAYGNISAKKAGQFAYTVYGGQRPSDLYGGITYGLLGAGIVLNSYAGKVVGGDARWTTPVKGLMLGSSFIDIMFNEDGTRIPTKATGYLPKPYTVTSTKDHTEVGYLEYTVWNLRFNAEARREVQDVSKTGVGSAGALNQLSAFDARAGFLSVAWRINKWAEIGGYHSRYYPLWHPATGNRGLYTNHIFDHTITARLDLTDHFDFKVEGHFMDGTAGPNSYHGFYSRDNPKPGPTTNLAVVRLGYRF